MFSAASTSGSVVAGTGTGVSLSGGGVSISAQNTTNQNAWAHGDAVGAALGVGDCSSNASSNVTTNAFLGAGATMGSQHDPDGALAITATGSDSNAAASTAGAGGVVSGDCAHAWTADDSTVTAEVSSDNDNPTKVYANQVTIRADKSSAFTPNVNAINASVVGGSGAEAWTNDSTSATATVGDSAAIVATGTVSIMASNTFTENTSGASVQTGSGGVVNGSSAEDYTTIGGTISDGQNNNDTASVIVGDSASITSGSDLVSSPGGITIGASSSVTAIDSITQSAGGVVEILYDIDQIDVNLNNMVSIGQSAKLFSYGNIGIGTTTTIDAETTALLHTYGLAGGGTADAYTNATSNQTVTVGQNAAITAVGNINLTAGTDPTGLTTSTMTASSDAYAQAEGLAGVPYANPGTTATSNATLNVDTGATINSGEDTIVGAYPGSPDATQIGTTEASALWIPIYGGGTLTTVSPTTSSQFTNDGAITAGYYHELTIDIPNQQNAGIYSSTITVNPDGSPSLTTSAALASDYSSSWDPQTFVTTNFVDPEKTMLLGSVSTNDDVFNLSQSELFASGGSVTVNAGTIAGNGAIAAWGGPKVTITNESPDYLILRAIGIPDHAGGNVKFTETRNYPSTMTVNPHQSTSTPTVTITLSSASGPALFLTGPIDNLGGTVSITNSYGSIGQTSAISALTVNMSSPNGTFAVNDPNEGDVVGSDPIAAWNSYMTWPGGNPANSTPNASTAAANLEVGTYTASLYSSATPPANTNPAITAKNVAITAQSIDVAGQILCGESTPSNWSVNLPSNLKAEVSAYQQANDLAPTTSVRLSDISGVTPVTPGDSLIDGTYDPVTNQITLDDVTSLEGGGTVYLKGTIISTNTLGKISVQGGSGTVDVNNQSGIPLDVQDITAGGNAGTPEAGDYSVEIDDTNPAGPSDKKYVYTAGQPIEVYNVASDGTLGTPTQVPGASTTFQPVSGTELQWVERARLNDTGQWSWNWPASTLNYPASTLNYPWVIGGSPPVGDPSQLRSNTDTDQGQVYINQQTFLGNENPYSFNFYATTTGHYVTPLVFSVSGSTYTLAAVYQSIQVSHTGSNTDPLSLIDGSLSPNTTYVFGFSDTQVTPGRGPEPVTLLNSYSGTIPFDDYSPGDWLHTQLGQTSPVGLGLGSTFSTGSDSQDGGLYTGRVYSASLSFSPPTNHTLSGNFMRPLRYMEDCRRS